MTAKASSRKRTARTRPAAAKATALVASRAGRAVADRGDKRFAEVVALIEAARGRAYQVMNAELVTHYWELGGYISRKIASAEWGDGVVEELASDLATRYPKRELEQQIRSGSVLREAQATKKVSPAVRQTHPAAIEEVKNAYNVEFLGLAADRLRFTRPVGPIRLGHILDNKQEYLHAFAMVREAIAWLDRTLPVSARLPKAPSTARTACRCPRRRCARS